VQDSYSVLDLSRTETEHPTHILPPNAWAWASHWGVHPTPRVALRCNSPPSTSPTSPTHGHPDMSPCVYRHADGHSTTCPCVSRMCVCKRMGGWMCPPSSCTHTRRSCSPSCHRLSRCPSSRPLSGSLTTPPSTSSLTNSPRIHPPTDASDPTTSLAHPLSPPAHLHTHPTHVHSPHQMTHLTDPPTDGSKGVH